MHRFKVQLYDANRLSYVPRYTSELHGAAAVVQFSSATLIPRTHRIGT